MSDEEKKRLSEKIRAEVSNNCKDCGEFYFNHYAVKLKYWRIGVPECEELVLCLSCFAKRMAAKGLAFDVGWFQDCKINEQIIWGYYGSETPNVATLAKKPVWYGSKAQSKRQHESRALAKKGKKKFEAVRAALATAEAPKGAETSLPPVCES